MSKCHIVGNHMSRLIYVLQIFGTIPWQSYFQRVLSVQSGSKARALSIAGALCSLVLVVPSILIGAASTVAGEFVS